MIPEEVLAELSQLIQDYFLWALTNPEEAAELSTALLPQASGKSTPVQSDLLGFARWLAQGRR